jgi:alpha-1,2-mannosyltransferase
VKSESLYGGGGSKFLYSPLVAAWFAPFSFLSENIAGILWRLFSGAILISALYIAAKAVWPRPGESRKALLALLALLPLAVDNLNNGQANPLVLALMLFSTSLALQKRWLVCGLCIGVAAYFKIYPLTLGLLLTALFPRQLSWRLALSIIALFALSFLLQRPSYVIGQYVNWFTHLGSINRRSVGEFGTWRDVYFLLRVAGIPITPRFWIPVEIFSGVCVAAFCIWGVYRNWQTGRLIFAALALGCAWMVLFGPATEAASYILLAPALIYGLLQSWAAPFSNWIRVGITTAYLGLIAASISDSWLHLKAHLVYARSFQPIFGLIFLATVAAWLVTDRYWSSSRDCQSSTICESLVQE